MADLSSSSISVEYLAENLELVPKLLARLGSVSSSRKVNSPSLLSIRTTSPRRVLGPNYSPGVDNALRGHGRSEDEAFEASRARRMVAQAKKVVDCFGEVREPTEGQGHSNSAKEGDAEDTMNLVKSVRSTINNLSAKGLKFRNYDPNRWSKITYDDFNNILVSGNANMNRQQLYRVASMLDKKQTGLIEYGKIMGALEDVEAEANAKRSEEVAVAEAAVKGNSKQKLEEKEEQISLIQSNNSQCTAQPLRGQQHSSAAESSFSTDENMANTGVKLDIVAVTKQADVVERASMGVSYAYKNIFKDSVKSIIESGVSMVEGDDRLLIRDTSVGSTPVVPSKRMFHDSMRLRHGNSAPFYVDNDDNNNKNSNNNNRSNRSINSTSNSSNNISRIDNYNDNEGSSINSIKNTEDLSSSRVDASISSSPDEYVPKDGKIQGQAGPLLTLTKSMSGDTGTDDRRNTKESHEAAMLELFGGSDPKVVENIKQRCFENSLAAQINGNLGGLRHNLKKMDASQSGDVSFEEFRHVLGHYGVNVPEESLRKYFSQHATLPMSSSMGFDSQRKALSIDKFVGDLRERSMTAAVLIRSTPNEVAETEERRVAKNIMLFMNRQADPLRVFNDLDKNFKIDGRVNVSVLKEGLHRSGVVLADEDFGLIKSKIKLDGDGRLCIKDFDSSMYSLVQNYDSKENNDIKVSKLSENSRYSNTFKSSIDCLNNDHFRDDNSLSLQQSQSHRSSSLQWQRLQRRLRDLHMAALSQPGAAGGIFLSHLFGDAHDGAKSLSAKEVVARLDVAGIRLGTDDREVLMSQLERGGDFSNDKSKDTLVNSTTYCHALGISVSNDSGASSVVPHITQPSYLAILPTYPLRADLHEPRKIIVDLNRKKKCPVAVPLSSIVSPVDLGSSGQAGPETDFVDFIAPRPYPAYRDAAPSALRSTQSSSIRIEMTSNICQNSLHPTSRRQLGKAHGYHNQTSEMPSLLFPSSSDGKCPSPTSDVSDTSRVINSNSRTRGIRCLSAPPRSAFRLNLNPDVDADTSGLGLGSELGLGDTLSPERRSRTLRKQQPLSVFSNSNQHQCPFALGY